MSERNNLGHSWAPGFFVPPSSSQCSIATQPPLPRKSKGRRKRHVPPGPAGVWYQAKQHIAAGNTATNDDDDDDDDALYSSTDNLPSHRKRYRGRPESLPAPDVTIHPAWMLMQLQLPRLLTPYLPPYATTAQRYAALRPSVPKEYMLLPELLADDTPLSALSLTDDNEQESPKLLVLVHAVHSHASCDWTVELHDETGTAIVAWIAPSLVMKERDTPDKVRAGVVWCLQGLSILPTMTSTSTRGNASAHDTNLIESKCLLVQENCIVQYWVAPKEVSPQVYLDWMQKRHALPSSFQCPTVPGANDDDVEQMEVEVDQPVSTIPRSIRASQQMRHGEEHDDDILPADFGLQVMPSLHLQSFQPRPTTIVDPHNSHGSKSVGASQITAPMDPYGRPSHKAESPPFSSLPAPRTHDCDADTSQTVQSHHSRNNPDSSPLVLAPRLTPTRPGPPNPYSAYAVTETVPSRTTQGGSPSAMQQPDRALQLEEPSLLVQPTIAQSDSDPFQLPQVVAEPGRRQRSVQKENRIPANSTKISRKTASPKNNQAFTNFLSADPLSMMAMFDDDDDDDDDALPAQPALKKACDETVLQLNGILPDTPSLFQSSHCIDGLMKMFDDDEDDD